MVILRSPATLVLFLLTILGWATFSDSYKKRLVTVVKKPTTWGKLALMGIFQSAAPFLLFSYGLKDVPASLGGAFMSVTPLCAILIQRTCCYFCIKVRDCQQWSNWLAGLPVIAYRSSKLTVGYHHSSYFNPAQQNAICTALHRWTRGCVHGTLRWEVGVEYQSSELDLDITVCYHHSSYSNPAQEEGDVYSPAQMKMGMCVW